MTVTTLLFGPGGTPNSTLKPRNTINGIRRVAELGLTCMELEFVQGVHMGEASAKEVAEVASRLGIRLTAHAPYYINLNSPEPEKVALSQERLRKTVHIATICGAESVVFHSAFYQHSTLQQTYDSVKKAIAEVISDLKKINITLWVRPELMGRHSQFGTLEELVRLSNELEGVMPAIDFAHWHARTGAYNSYSEFASVLQFLNDELGERALQSMHMHVSGIAYGAKGEKNHLNLQESDFQYRELLQALKDYRAGGFVICESPNLEEDALLLQSTYDTL